MFRVSATIWDTAIAMSANVTSTKFSSVVLLVKIARYEQLLFCFRVSVSSVNKSLFIEAFICLFYRPPKCVRLRVFCVSIIIIQDLMERCVYVLSSDRKQALENMFET